MLWLSLCVLRERIACATTVVAFSSFRGGSGPASSGSWLGELNLSLPSFIKVLQAAAPLEELQISECGIRPRKYDMYAEAGGAPFL